MIDTQKVYEYIKAIGNYDEEEIAAYAPLIDNAVSAVCQSLGDGVDMQDARVICLAGAKANYTICLARASGDGVVDFKAGDISISQSNDYIAQAKQLLELAYKDCAVLVVDDGFAFLGV